MTQFLIIVGLGIEIHRAGVEPVTWWQSPYTELGHWGPRSFYTTMFYYILSTIEQMMSPSTLVLHLLQLRHHQYHGSRQKPISVIGGSITSHGGSSGEKVSWQCNQIRAGEINSRAIQNYTALCRQQLQPPSASYLRFFFSECNEPLADPGVYK